MNFFCGLHSLIHFAETSNKVLIEVEQGFFGGATPIFDKSFITKKEYATTRLVRTASKALARGADEKSGRYTDFFVFIDDHFKENGLHSVPLQPFHGNRFNILFESSASLFFLHKHITQFLEGNQSNNLLKSVLHDIQIPEFVAGVKALGLISRHLTGPLWSLLENKDLHILDMNEKYLQLVIFLSDETNNIESFMAGNNLLWGCNS